MMDDLDYLIDRLDRFTDEYQKLRLQRISGVINKEEFGRRVIKLIEKYDLWCVE